MNDEQTETVTGALSQNSPYMAGSSPFQTHGATDVGATMFNNGTSNNAYLAFVRTDSRIGVIVEKNLNNNTGQNFTSYALSDTTNYGPALISYNRFLYLFYVGMNRNFYMRRSPDGVSWQGPWLLASYDSSLYTGFEYRPAPVVLNGTLIVYVVMEDCSLPLIANCGGYNRMRQYNLNSDGVSVSGPYQPGQEEFTNHTPAATVWNGVLYLSWAGTNSNNPIYMKRYDPSFGWSSDTDVSEPLGLFGQPALFPLSSSQMELVYRGNDGHIYHALTSDHTAMSFSSTVRDNGSTTDHPPAPFLASGPSDVWVFYPGQNSELYTALE